MSDALKSIVRENALLRAEVDDLRAKLDNITHDAAATIMALQELAHGPSIPGIPYWVHDLEDGTKRREIPASDVGGIFEALATRAEELMPYGHKAVKALYDNESLQFRLEQAEKQSQEQERALIVHYLRRAAKDFHQFAANLLADTTQNKPEADACIVKAKNLEDLAEFIQSGQYRR